MLAIIPVTKQTAAAIHGQRVLYEKLGPNREHDLLVPVAPEFMQEAQELATAVKSFFRRVDLLPVAVLKLNPDSAEYRTAFFRKVCQDLAAKGNTLPFLWMENATPTNADWLDIVEDEWNRKPVDRFFLGCIEENVHRAVKNGVVLLDPPLFKRAGRFMRFGVYPPDILSRCPSLLTTGTKENFETLMRNEIVPVCQLSTTLATVWASVGWERESNLVVRGEQDPRFESEYRKRASTRVNESEISVIHGCRDGSLAFVESRKRFEKTRVRKAPSVAPKASDSPAVEALLEENSELKARLARLEAALGLTSKDPEEGVTIGQGVFAEGGSAGLEQSGTPETPASGWGPIVFPEQSDEVVSTLDEIEEDFGDEEGGLIDPETGDVDESSVEEVVLEPEPEDDFAETATIEEVATAQVAEPVATPATEPQVGRVKRPMVGGRPFPKKTIPEPAVVEG